MNDIYINISQTTVFGKAAGDPGNLLVLGLHGWSQRNGWHTWQPMIEPLADAGFFVVSVDMPGWGKSSPTSDSPLVGKAAVEVIIEILDALEVDRAALMGKSWGGGVAVKTAVDFPDRVSHLILTAPALRNYGQLKSLQQPALLVWAEDDPVIPMAHAQRFIDAVPHTVLVTYKNGGHSAAPKNADDFAPKAIEFLHH